MSGHETLESTIHSFRDLLVSDIHATSDEVGKLKDNGSVVDDDSRDTEHSEDDNEFLNSSSFLSNSQIIRMSNVNALKATEDSAEIMDESPTRSEVQTEKASAKGRSHFQLFIPSQSLHLDSDNSDNETQEENGTLKEENLSDDELSCRPTKEVSENTLKQPLFRPMSSLSRSTSKPTKKFMDIDDQTYTPKLPQINPEHTPWRKLRPSSMFLKENFHINDQQSGDFINDKMSSNFTKSFFNDENKDTNGPSPFRSASMFEPIQTGLSDETGSSFASYELNNLRKQITSYKVQLRLFAEYIRTLLKVNNNFDGLENELITKFENESDAFLNERELLQTELQNKEGKALYDIEKDQRYESKLKEIVELKNDLISTKTLNDELNTNIQDSQKRIDNFVKEMELRDGKVSNWELLLNELLSYLLNFLKGECANAVKKAKSGSTSIDNKIKVISFAINEILEDFEELKALIETNRTSNQNRYLNPTLPQNISIVFHQIKSELEASKSAEKDLKELLTESSNQFNKLKNEYKLSDIKYREILKLVSNLKRHLAEKQSEITELNDKIFEIESNSIERSEEYGGSDESKLLKNRINVIKANHSKEIELLNSELKELKAHIAKENRYTTWTTDRKLTEESIRLKKEIKLLTDEIKSIQNEYFESSQSYEKSIAGLKDSINSDRNEFEILNSDYQNLQKALRDAQEELMASENDYKRKLDHAAKELNQSVIKQRTLADEKSKLAFAVEDLKRENSKLNLNNNSLTDKINRLSYQVSNLSAFEVGFNNMRKLSLSNLQNLLKYFKSILEPTSFKQAESKLNKLRDPNLTDLEAIHSLHRSLLSYFENAVVSIVEEYSEMFAANAQKEHDHTNNNDEELNRLKEEVAALTEELEWCYSNGNFNQDSQMAGDISPRTKMRLAELEKRRKLEREQRKSEHVTFSTRIKNLEKENAELKEQLRLSSQ